MKPFQRSRGLRFLVAASVLAALVASAGGSMVIMPGRSYKGELPPLTAEESVLRDRLREHVTVLAGEIGERNTLQYKELRQAAQYLREHFRGVGLPVRDDAYLVEAKEMVNVEAELKGASRPQEIVVVGAHYDSVPSSPGADDNATGVATLLELARLLGESKPGRTIRFVAFVNEEPPYFQTEQMGSLVYARRARERKEKIVAMLSLETIGFYSTRNKSQQYPSPLNHFYPDTGNFIAFVSDIGSARLLRRTIGTFREKTRFPSEGAAAPRWMMGIAWSDHWAFWQAGYPGIMITDTAPFRYPHYHGESDTPDKIEFGMMARVVNGLRDVVRELAR